MTASADAGSRAPSGRLARPSLIWIAVVAVLLVGLPVAILADLRELSRTALTKQAEEFSRIIDDVRDFYARDVVARVIAAHGEVQPTGRFRRWWAASPSPRPFRSSLAN